jgi:hypothetical protein
MVGLTLSVTKLTCKIWRSELVSNVKTSYPRTWFGPCLKRWLNLTRFNALDKLIVVVHSVKMPVGHGRGVKTKGRQLEVMAHLKRSTIEVKAEPNCLAHALIIAIARLSNDPNYITYRKGNKTRPEVDHLLRTTGIDLTDGGDIPELALFQEHFKTDCRLRRTTLRVYYLWRRACRIWKKIICFMTIRHVIMWSWM